MTITKLIYNQTEQNVKVNNSTLRPGGEMSTTTSTLDVYKTPYVFYKFLDSVISQYAITGEFVIYLTDQHGYVEDPYFSDTTIFMSVETGKCVMYLAKMGEPINDPPIYLYNKVGPKVQKSKIDKPCIIL
jgi:hypothetical protein